jgi:hypothetical protein
MSPTASPFSSARLRRRIALAMAVAVLIAGIAQASHFHKLEPGQHTDVHLQCLLCLYAAGTAGPPEVARLIQGAVARRCYISPAVASPPQDAAIASYHARGPPPA